MKPHKQINNSMTPTQIIRYIMIINNIIKTLYKHPYKRMHKKYSISLYILTQIIINYELHTIIRSNLQSVSLSTSAASIPLGTSQKDEKNQQNNHVVGVIGEQVEGNDTQIDDNDGDGWGWYIFFMMAVTIVLYTIIALIQAPIIQPPSLQLQPQLSSQPTQQPNTLPLPLHLHLRLPLRSKHCKICNKTIPTFDHHCNLLNTCIHQKNRPIFILYLISQCIQITICLSLIFIYQFQYGVTGTSTVILSLLVVLWPIACGMTGLHIWMMCVGVTTYEVIKGRKIWYIGEDYRKIPRTVNLNMLQQVDSKQPAELNQRKENTTLNSVPEQDRRVFDQGFIKNVYLYWLPLCKSDLIDWKQYYHHN